MEGWWRPRARRPAPPLNPHATPLPPPSPGLANAKTVDIAAAPGGGIAITVSRPKHASKPALSRHTTVAKTSSSARLADGAGRAAGSLRPDLKRAAAARASARARAARAAKAAAGKAAPEAAAPMAEDAALA